MKKLLLLGILLISQIGVSQLQLTANTDGTVNVSYGSSGDYSLYDPLGDTQIYIYMWIDENQTTPQLSMQFNDDWNDAAGLVVITYDNTLQKFTGTIDLNTHNFSGEGLLPSGIQINDFNLILRNQAGDRQSANLLASNYGFQGTTEIAHLAALDYMHYAHGNLIIDTDVSLHDLYISIYNLQGQLLSSFTPKNHTINLKMLKDPVLIIRINIQNNKDMVLKILK